MRISFGKLNRYESDVRIERLADSGNEQQISRFARQHDARRVPFVVAILFLAEHHLDRSTLSRQSVDEQRSTGVRRDALSEVTERQFRLTGARPVGQPGRSE